MSPSGSLLAHSSDHRAADEVGPELWGFWVSPLHLSEQPFPDRESHRGGGKCCSSLTTPSVSVRPSAAEFRNITLEDLEGFQWKHHCRKRKHGCRVPNSLSGRKKEGQISGIQVQPPCAGDAIWGQRAKTLHVHKVKRLREEQFHMNTGKEGTLWRLNSALCLKTSSTRLWVIIFSTRLTFPYLLPHLATE